MNGYPHDRELPELSNDRRFATRRDRVTLTDDAYRNRDTLPNLRIHHEICQSSHQSALHRI